MIKFRFLSIVLCCNFFIRAHESPKLTVIIVIDQFAYHELQKLIPHMQGGIKFLFNNGINYTNAHQINGATVTAAGHAAIATGTLARDHGFVNNKWYTPEGKKINCDDDTADQAAVFTQTGLYNFGKSAHNLMVDTLSDQLILARDARYQVYALSLKSRAAIPMAGKLGKALWFDHDTGSFTSSKAYFKELPAWVKQFNQKNFLTKKSYTWQLAYNKNSRAYNFPFIHDYRFIEGHKSIIGVPLTYENFERTPQANQLLLDCALALINNTLKPNRHDHLVLWLSLSSLDKVGHQFGPHSMEAIDMLYHMDKQLNQFIAAIYKKVPQEDVLFVLTSDHGVQPIPELTHGKRIYKNDIKNSINKALFDKYGIERSITQIKVPFVYINPAIQKTLDKQTKKELLYDIIKLFKNSPGIKDAWLSQDLIKLTFDCNDPRNYLKNHFYPRRSGDIIFQVEPYTYLSSKKFGTGHSLPYAYNTHVPLIVYQAGMHKKVITKRVTIPQLAPTLARLLNVPAPQASTFNVLPGI